MDKLVIQGPSALKGTIAASGAKNAALPLMAVCLLTDEPVTLSNVPNVRDIDTMCQMLGHMGAEATRTHPNQVELRVTDVASHTAPYDIVRKMRASVCALGPLLAKRGKARISLPGGCIIGTRPIDLHLKGLRALGANITIEHGYIEASCDKLTGTRIFLQGPYGSSVLATANIMMAATLAHGTTTLSGAACEPEMIDLATLLNAMGARIKGAGSPTIIIEGVDSLRGTEHRVMPDRIEAGTFLIAGALCAGTTREEAVEVTHMAPEHLEALLDQFTQLDVPFERGDDAVAVWRKTNYTDKHEVITLPYPGYPTDLQAQMMTLLCANQGTSIITEKIFPDRFMHVAELDRLGADISVEGPSAIIRGVSRLSGTQVMASDLRASAALVLAGLVAEGETVVNRVYHLDRGYETMETKLQQLGARITRTQ